MENPKTDTWIIDGNFSVRDIPSLLFALSPELGLDIKAITITHGKSDVKKSAQRVQNLLNLLGKSIDIFIGAENPLVQPKVDVSEDQSDAEYDVPEVPQEKKVDLIKDEHASLALTKLSQKYSGNINLLCIGPLTNIILAYHIDSKLYEKFNKVIIGGGTSKQRGSLSKSGDYNFGSDAHSANLIIKIFKEKCTIVPSEVSFEYQLNEELHSKSEFWTKISHILRNQSATLGAVLVLADKGLIKNSITTRCMVETRSRECLGQLLILWPINVFFSRAFPDVYKEMMTINVVLETDVEKGKSLLKNHFSSFKI